jgi:hypothetical protein
MRELNIFFCGRCCGVQIFSRRPVQRKKAQRQESKKSAIQEFLHSNLLAAMFSGQGRLRRPSP